MNVVPWTRPFLGALALIVLAVPGQRIHAQEGLLEFEVLSVDPASFTVRARAVESGQEIQFRLPPQAFVGKRFDAQVEGVEPGQRFTAQGAPNSRVQGETPRGWEEREAAPGRAGAPGREGGGAFQVTRVQGEGDGFVVVARAPRGRTLTFRLDATAFRGYRFTVDPANLRRGGPFELIAPNQAALRDCCTLVSVGG